MTHNEAEYDEVSLKDEDLEILENTFKEIVELRDRKYGFPPKTYVKCFIGSEAVEQMVEAGIAADSDGAVFIGNILLNSGVFHHVQRAHGFKNEYLFYRFSRDEEHGTLATESSSESYVTWSDVLFGGLPKEIEDRSLQPSLPESEMHDENMTQVEIQSVGISPLDEHNAKLLDNVHPRKWVDPEPKSSYNLLVVGAGAGGLVTSAGAAGVGAQVALVESHLLGGDCLNVGCVPSKALLRCAKAAAAVRNADKFGVRVKGEVSVDFGFVMERMRRLRAQISPVDSAKRYSEQLGVDVFMGRGVFTGKHSLEVNGKTLTFKKAVVATGGTAAIPQIPGLEDVQFLTNSNIFNLTELPASLGIIGAGPIGLELAQAFQRFGSKVYVFLRGNKILPKEDPDAAEIVKRSLEEDGVTFIPHVTFKKIERQGDGNAARLIIESGAGKKRFDVDGLLIATGRKPTVNGLGLEAAGVEYDDRKGVFVNDKLQSSNPDIYGVGDVASKFQFTHMADFMARLVIKNALFFGRDKVSDLLIPWATYTEPEVAHVGLYEKDLKEKKLPYATFRREFDDVDRAIVDGEKEGYVKIHVDKGKGNILGATIVGSHAGDMISEISVAMQSGMGLGQLATVIHPYPTAAEAIRQCGDAFNRKRLTPTIKALFHRIMALRR